nr:RuBisCO large subunit-binding protein subunit beta, chloroplastic [Tanacetum cinerariifolium]
MMKSVYKTDISPATLGGIISSLDYWRKYLGIVNRLRGALNIVTLKDPEFGERKSQYLDDIVVFTREKSMVTGKTDEVGLTFENGGSEVLKFAAKVVLTKDTPTIIGDGSTQELISKRVAQI